MTAKEPSREAVLAAKDVLDDLAGRNGLGGVWRQVPEGIRELMAWEWARKIDARFRGAVAEPAAAAAQGRPRGPLTPGRLSFLRGPAGGGRMLTADECRELADAYASMHAEAAKAWALLAERAEYEGHVAEAWEALRRLGAR